MPNNPFASIDQKGVGQLMEIARRNRPQDAAGHQARHLRRTRRRPASVKFCHRLGLGLRQLQSVPRADRAAGRSPGRTRSVTRSRKVRRAKNPKSRNTAKVYNHEKTEAVLRAVCRAPGRNSKRKGSRRDTAMIVRLIRNFPGTSTPIANMQKHRSRRYEAARRGRRPGVHPAVRKSPATRTIFW